MSKPPQPDGPARLRGRPRAFNDTTAQNTIRALDRALELLALLARSDGLTLTELAAQAGESPATVYRVLVTLQGHAIAEVEADTQHWHVGPGAFRIGSGFLRRTKVAERSRGAMQALMRTTGETANLGVEADGRVLFLTQVETHEAIRAFFPPGTKSPMHVSGIGKALLAWAAPERVTQIVARQRLDGFTPRSITDAGALAADLAATRARGFALDDEERTPGMRCVAAPVFDALGVAVAGLSVSGPAFRLQPDALPALGAAVRAAADAVTHAIGGQPPRP